MLLRILSDLSAIRIAFCVAGFYAVLAVFGFVDAQLWSQVTYLNNMGWTVSNWHAPFDELPSQLQQAKDTQHPAHRLRYFLTTPLFWLSDVTQVSEHSFYSACVPFFAAVTVWSAARVLLVQGRINAVGLLGALALLPLMGIFC